MTFADPKLSLSLSFSLSRSLFLLPRFSSLKEYVVKAYGGISLSLSLSLSLSFFAFVLESKM